MNMDRKLDFIIGEEKSLADLLNLPEALKLLDGAVSAGASGAEITDYNGLVLAVSGFDAPASVVRTIYLEGEPVGILKVSATDSDSGVDGVADMLHSALNTLINSSMKRMLTSEAHTKIVNSSYQELLEANGMLAESERRYRELAATLEIKVEKRTEELNRAYATLLQKEKLAAIGGLAAGMAHEINNPVGFVISNLNTLSRYAEKLGEMLKFYRVKCEPVMPVDFALEAGAQWDRLKIDYVLSDIDGLMKESLDGAERIQKLVADMRGFSHVDEVGAVLTDINIELEQTLSVLKHETGDDVQIECKLGSLPRVNLNPALLSLAFLQIIQNALQLETPDLKISLKTGLQGDDVFIRIADNGPGIPPEIRDRIFEPFFTTKDVGHGIGMGLTVAQQAVQACGGTVVINCPEEGGTVFTITIPAEGIQQ
ncbi:MAG: ATP-binding protein [Desulfuromonadaceae bacterium]|nr:ATP-binding protein [Desulfuromonadaceae bacterium]MDD2855223.1 ATP-binding protein [Desulfuromonadaceae bacterium]